MIVNCPKCARPIPVQDVALDAGWAKCSQCNEVFQLAGVLKGFAPNSIAAAAIPERPFDAWALVKREAASLVIHLPAQGMRAGTWAMLGFSLFWLGFIAFWTVGALGIGMFANPGGIKLENAIFAAFSIPFWGAGFCLVGRSRLAVARQAQRVRRPCGNEPNCAAYSGAAAGPSIAKMSNARVRGKSSHSATTVIPIPATRRIRSKSSSPRVLSNFLATAKQNRPG
jgi:hypothetical protein